MARQQRLISNTGIYHIMLRGNERKTIFANEEEKQYFLNGVEIKRNEIGFSIYAYCLMDNHIHMLFNTNEKDLSTIMKGIAVRYAYFYNTKHRRIGHVFQDRFRSESVENERYLLAVIRYIHNNPIKAGIVTKPEEYYWSSFKYYIEPRLDTDMVDTQFILALLSNDRKIAVEEFKRFSSENDGTKYLDYLEEEEIRTLDDGRVFLQQYLKKEWSGRELEEVLSTNRKEIITDLRSQTKLPIRAIAELLGVNRNIVERIRVK